MADAEVAKTAFEILNDEIEPSQDPVLASLEYRKSLSLALFYKFMLYVNQFEIGPRFVSAIETLIDSRPVSTGSQDFSSNPSMYPVTKPMAKLNAYLQTSGEAQYVYDMPLGNNDLNATFIISSKANCRLDKVDLSRALKSPGVVKILLAKDIPGKNSFLPSPMQEEKLLCDDYVDYAGQAVGVVIAKTFEQAVNATKLVDITYKDAKKPILTIKQAIEQNSFFPDPPDDFVYGDVENALKKAAFVMEGECELGTQFHFYMENQVAVAKPSDDGIDVFSSTQWLDLVQNGVAQVLGLKNNARVNVRVKQVGGAYGGKITRANIAATGAALASHAINRQVRLALNLATNMEMIGKRFPWYAKYTIGVDKDGKLLGIRLKMYVDCGNAPNDSSLFVTPQFIDNTYSCKNWRISFFLAKTNLPANTYCRSPGNLKYQS